MDVPHSRVNPYRLPSFYNHICFVAPEFVLWTGVMSTKFKSPYIRASSSSIEGDFNELKNNILREIQGTLLLDKAFHCNFEALLGQCKIALSKMVTKRMQMTEKSKESEKNEEDRKSDHSNFSGHPEYDSDLDKKENWRNQLEENVVLEEENNILDE